MKTETKNQIEFVLNTEHAGTCFLSQTGDFAVYNRDKDASNEDATWMVKQVGADNTVRGLTYEQAIAQANKWALPRAFDVNTEELTVTSAPADYDFGRTWTVSTVGLDKKGREIRIVASPKGHPTAYQVGRYCSGLHLAVDLNDWEKLKSFTLQETAAV